MNRFKQNVVVLGGSGMLGHAILQEFFHDIRYNTIGTVRSTSSLNTLPPHYRQSIVNDVKAENIDSLIHLFTHAQPNIVINCIGMVKQLAGSEDPLTALPINSILPHRLANLCALAGARLIHISTDCVFSGEKGNYIESDRPDATDLYGRSKLLGEVDYENAVTLRTSIIGHELGSPHGLVGWFLGQNTMVRGYRRAIFSGLPTVELARIIRDHVIPSKIRGVYHVSSAATNKYKLLQLISKTYGKEIEIQPDDLVSINRSLDSSRFQSATGYTPPNWPDLIEIMMKSS